MKSLSAASLLLAAATAVSAVSSAADLSTISRTSIHTTCPSSTASNARYYGNSTIAANIAASPATSSESDVVLYETELYTKDSTVTLVSTSCSADRCEVTTILESLTTVIATVDGVLTTYVTGVPITPTTTIAQKPKVTAVAQETSSVVGEEVTVTKPVTTVVTITSCSHDICKKTAVTTGVTVVTAQVDGVKTVYTTYCPLSGESTPTTEAAKKTDIVETSETPVPIAPAPVTVTKPATTIITITSCKENKCEKVPVTTGVSAYSTTINGVVTDYTTYCPLNSESTSETTPAPEIPTVQKSSNTPASESTVNVITNNIVTQSKTFVFQSASTSSAMVSIYEGAAHRAVPAVLALPVLYLLL